ncbi:hypothetical protein PCANC_18705 [Puccinia coronata f. sp. avenae]|uniref:Uncharacterized protein n=1 Tax=Puccinia coronata f. sp. avenae TaxID=200324 RepID=A0A2N5TYW9_9BASI|nr:hypothetical protein PCANC_18705 [Puccinia coronata f. sp. avenae]
MDLQTPPEPRNFLPPPHADRRSPLPPPPDTLANGLSNSIYSGRDVLTVPGASTDVTMDTTPPTRLANNPSPANQQPHPN